VVNLLVIRKKEIAVANSMQYSLPPSEGFVLTHSLTVDDADRPAKRSADFYSRALGDSVVREGEPSVIQLANIWIVVNVGGGPTDDKPTVVLHISQNPGEATGFMNIRVADIYARVEEWQQKGAEFLTEPKHHATEIRCYMRDPDGDLIEVGQDAALTSPSLGVLACLSLGRIDAGRLAQSRTSRGSSMRDVVARLDLSAINKSLMAVENDWPRIDAELARLKIGRKDPFTAFLRGNMVSAYSYLDQLMEQGIPPLSDACLEHLLLLNERVHYGTDAGLRAEYQAAIAATVGKFNRNIEPILDWHERHMRHGNNPYKLAAETYVSIVGQPQLLWKATTVPARSSRVGLICTPACRLSCYPWRTPWRTSRRRLRLSSLPTARHGVDGDAYQSTASHSKYLLNTTS
jgi:hypothetical protein